MLLEHVEQTHIGDIVTYKGEERVITDIILTSSAAPQFLLAGSPDGAISYRLVETLASVDGNLRVNKDAHSGFDLPRSKVRGNYP